MRVARAHFSLFLAMRLPFVVPASYDRLSRVSRVPGGFQRGRSRRS